MTDEQLYELAARVVQTGGVAGVTLGGSRGRGDHSEASDFDVGIYYRPPLDVDGLRDLARREAGPAVTLTGPGGWGPWVDGGGWLNIDGQAVDWIYRDLDRVHQAWRDAQRGSFDFHSQVGHPLGVPDFAYAGEVALGKILDDPTGELAELQRQTGAYPPALSEALVARLWEATFMIGVARKATHARDTTYVAGCLFRAVAVCVHALHGRAGRWLINEKGAVASAARLEIAPKDFDRRAHDLLARTGRSEADLIVTLDAAARLVADTGTACRANPLDPTV